MSNFFNTKWSDRGPFERGILLAASIGGTVFLLIKGKSIIEKIQQQRQQAQIGRDIAATGRTVSYSDSQFNSFADILYTAMNGVGTDEEGVAGIMYKMKNDADVLKLIQIFGQKDGYTLAEWIASEFSQEDKSFYINGILAKKGISFRF